MTTARLQTCPLPSTAAIPRRRILVIDDEEFDQKIYSRIIQRSGLFDEVVSFLDGQSALNHLSDPETRPIDVVLLDINMPRMSGFEFLDAARERMPQGLNVGGIVILSTSASPKDKERAAHFEEVDGYFTKPLNVEMLTEITELVAGQKGPLH